LVLRTEAAVLRAAYEEALAGLAPLRHRSTDSLLQARALRTSPARRAPCPPMTTPSAMTTLEPTTMPTSTPEAGPGDARLTAMQLLQREPTVRRLHPAQDVMDGVLWYGRPVEGGLVMITNTTRCQSNRAPRCRRGVGRPIRFAVTMVSSWDDILTEQLGVTFL
jgi:hypothetical protein